jgi:hypothetical protein
MPVVDERSITKPGGTRYPTTIHTTHDADLQQWKWETHRSRADPKTNRKIPTLKLPRVGGHHECKSRTSIAPSALEPSSLLMDGTDSRIVPGEGPGFTDTFH